MTSRIEQYALIGDTQTAALVADDGSIDWLCVPRFDSGACFAALLGNEQNGRWLIGPAAGGRATRRKYRDGTLVLETEFDTPDGTVRVVDCMPIRDRSIDVVRVVEGVSGAVPMKFELIVRFDYGSVLPWVQADGNSVSMVAGPNALRLNAPFKVEGHELRHEAEFVVRAGEKVPFVLTWFPSFHRDKPPDDRRAPRRRENHRVVERLVEPIDVPRQVGRAGATLGDHVEGADLRPDRRNRRRAHDVAPRVARQRAQLGLPVLLVARRDVHAVLADERRVRQGSGGVARLAVARGGGRSRAPADHVRHDAANGVSPSTRSTGSADTRARRRCESATRRRSSSSSTCTARSFDALHQTRQMDVPEDPSAWALQRAILEFLEAAWKDADEGIWEVRGGRQDFTHSKVMAWVAFDRAVKAVEQFGLDGPVDTWRATRDEVHREVCERGFDAERNTFTQYYGSQGSRRQPR